MNKKSVSVLTIIRIAMVAALLIFFIVFQVGNKSSNASLESVSENVVGCCHEEGAPPLHPG